MAAVALEQLADADQRERQDDPVGLGDRERALERGSDGARVAEPSCAAAASSSASIAVGPG